MLKIDGKTFMNIQEAVQWLLDNNALPFQCTANYAPLTEIGMGTIVNPSPAKVRIGSLIFFADSKVSTVVGITENGFICSDQYNDLVDDIVYVSNVTINASGHLICTLSNGDTIDAGLIKQVSSFSINASQQLVVTFNDGSTQNLGSIFSGNVNIAGNLTADSIVENMSGYTFTKYSQNFSTVNMIFAGAVKNGNKLTFVVALEITRTTSATGAEPLGAFTIPAEPFSKLYPTTIGGRNCLVYDVKPAVEKANENMVDLEYFITKGNSRDVGFNLRGGTVNNLTLNTTYYFRIEATFLLSESLAS